MYGGFPKWDPQIIHTSWNFHYKPAIGVPPWIGNPHCSCDVCNICASHLPKSLVRGLCERLCFTGTQVITVKPLEPSKKASFFDGFSSPNHL